MSVDICLVSPPRRAYNHYRPPLALMFLASYLEKNSIKTAIIDPKSKKEVYGLQKEIIINEILYQVNKLKSKIVGISCYTNEFNDVIDIASKIKESIGAIIIVGGVHATLRPQDFFFKGSPVDFVVTGEGEITLFELTKAILNNDINLRCINGIGFYDKDKNEYIQTQPRALIHNLDAMPFPAYNLVDMKYYVTPNPYAVRGLYLSTFYFLVGRGCPAQCTFCVSAQIRKAIAPGKALRCRSAKNVVEEIEFVKEKYLIDGFYFIDDNFTLNKDLVFDICEELIKRRLNLIWACSTRINTASEELLRKMKEAGCIQVDLGVESGSIDVLKRIKKNISIKQVKEVFRICRKLGIRTFANILINLPDETEDDLRITLELLNEIKPSVTSFNIFTPYLGTEIYESSSLNLSPSEYSLLGRPPLELVQDQRFRFAKHKIDFKEFYTVNHPKFNSLHTFLPYYLSSCYIKQLIKSKRKYEYILQLKNLFREYFKQSKLI